MVRMTRWYALGTCVLAACSSTKVTSTNGGPDASNEPIDAAADAPAEAATDGGSTECNDLANVASPVEQSFVAENPPTAIGGNIVSGTYVMTAFVIYTGPSGKSGPTGMTLQETFVVQEGASGGTYQRVQSASSDGGAAGSAQHVNGEYVHLAGARLEGHETCPQGPTPFDAYDSDGTKLRLYAPAAGPGSPALRVEYTKR